LRWDTGEAAGWRLALAPTRGSALSDFRVAIMLEDPNCEVDREIQTILQKLADFLAREGVRVSDRARPDIDLAHSNAVYIQLLRAATSRRLNQQEFEQQTETARRLDPADQSYFARTLRATRWRTGIGWPAMRSGIGFGSNGPSFSMNMICC